MRISDWSSDVCSSDLLVLHLLEMLANDMQAGVRQQVMDVGDPPGAGVLDRDHGIAPAALVHGGTGVFEGGAGQGGHFRTGGPAGPGGKSRLEERRVGNRCVRT